MNFTREFLLETPDGDLDWYKLTTWGMFLLFVAYLAGSAVGLF